MSMNETMGEILNSLETDEELMDYLISARYWTKPTAKGYKVMFNMYKKTQKDSMINLLKEGYQEKKQKIDWEETRLKTRLTTFKKHLYKNYNISTSKINYSRAVTVYKHFEIKVGKLQYINDKGVRKTPPLRFKQLPTKMIFQKAVKISSPLMSSIIFFMSSSGCARNETLNLTIQDFIEATTDYHDEIKIDYVISELISQKGVVPTFDIYRSKTNKYYETFCSDEAVQGILSYILTREDPYQHDSRLFKISHRHFDLNFKKINDLLGLGFVGTYRRFTSHKLRKYHASRLAMSSEDPKTGFEIPGMNRDDINALQGRGKGGGSDDSYFFDDFESLRKQYIQSLPKLRIFDKTSMIQQSKEYCDLKKSVKETENENNQLKLRNDELEQTNEKASQLINTLNSIDLEELEKLKK